MAVVPGVSRTHTPRSIADRAIDLGMPRGAVERVLTAFRAAEYGGKSSTPDEEELRSVKEAIDEFRAGEGEVTDR
jgi:hypothetical protein